MLYQFGGWCCTFILFVNQTHNNISCPLCSSKSSYQTVIKWLKDSAFLCLFSFLFVVRSNFFGTRFVVYDAQPPHSGVTISRSRPTRLVGSKQIAPRVPAGNYPVVHIAYELNVLGSR